MDDGRRRSPASLKASDEAGDLANIQRGGGINGGRSRR